MRFGAAAVAAVLVFAVGAAAADPVLRLVSQDATTVTLGWDPVSGAEGFRFSSSGSSRRSHTWDGARTSVRFAKADSYMVERIDTSVTGVYPGTSPPPSPAEGANLWVWNGGFGSCEDSPTLSAFDAAKSCRNLDAANNVCDAGDVVYVRTANAYAGETITDSNSRSGMCTIEPEPGTGKIRVTTDVAFGVPGGDGPDWLTVRGVQCGPATFTNEAELFVWDDTDSVVLDGWDCASFDIFSDGGVTVSNGDWGPCGSSASRKCVPRVARSNVSLVGNAFHDIQCGTGSAAQCNLYHTDGLAIFGGSNITLRGNVFYRNDITNVRIQTCCGNVPLANLVIDTNVFMRPCIDAGTGANCTGAFRSDGVDVDSSVPGLVVRFNTFADQAYLQCTGPSGCGTAANPALVMGNIMSAPDGMCSTPNTTLSYNAFNAWGGGSGARCGTNRMGSYPAMVNASNTAMPPDAHLVGPVGNADDLVVSGCAGVDMDGSPRQGSVCDAGADNR